MLDSCMENQKQEELCPKCKGTGIVKEKNGSTHTCWDCLAAGRLDVHSKNVKDSGIKI
jgi:DnaJ-class molecular chaperone